jgi:hypothetical protein
MKSIIFAVISHNLDIPSDGHTVLRHYHDKSDAFKHCIKYVEQKQGSEVFEDSTGMFQCSMGMKGVSLEYRTPKGRPAIYYKSHYGNYNCCIYLKRIEVL